jgi:DNA-binding LacI/PurR family transcriptional regulator
MPDQIPTLKAIADKLNFSVSTVSRALTNHPRIGLRTRELVQKTAKELGYEPNPKAIFFKQQKSFVIGVIMPSIREEFFSQAISGMETAAMEQHYTILFGQSFDNLEREMKVVETMKQQRVDGLIISLAKETNKYDHLLALEKYNIPVVYFDRVPNLEKAHKVFCNLYKGTVDMVGWLFNKGYRRIALINGPDKLAASKERLNGYIEGVSKQKLKVDMQLVETTDFSKDSTQRAMKKLLALKQAPTAVITFNDYVHMDAVQYANKQHIEVNKEMAFVSYANLPITSYTAYPPMVSVEQYPYSQGLKAMEMMIHLLNQKKDHATVTAFLTEEIRPSLVAYLQ